MTLVGLGAPGAWAEVGVHVAIVNQPTPAGVDELITASGYDPTGGDAGFVQVQVTETVLVPDLEGEGFHEETGPVVGAEVTFERITFGRLRRVLDVRAGRACPVCRAPVEG